MIPRAILFVAVCVSVVAAFAAEPTSVEQLLRQRAEALVGKSLMFSVAVAAVHGDNTYTACVGHRSLGGALTDENTLFEIGSVTKTFTTLLLADAVVRNDVKLDQPVAQLLGPDAVVPKFEEHEIRLVDLATQTSGLPRLPTNMWIVNPLNPYSNYSADDLEKFLAGYKLKRRPGEEFGYSNLGMGLLGHAMAKKAGKSYEEMVQELICRPLGMTDTAITLSQDQQSRLASGILPFGLPTMSWDIPGLPGCGAIRSTLHDMLIYVRAHLSPDKTPLATAIALAHEPRFTIRQPTAKYPDKLEIGLAWFITTDGDHKIIWHNGMTYGCSAYVAFVPDKQWGVVVLGNQATESIDELGNNLAQGLTQ